MTIVAAVVILLALVHAPVWTYVLLGAAAIFDVFAFGVFGGKKIEEPPQDHREPDPEPASRVRITPRGFRYRE